LILATLPTIAFSFAIIDGYVWLGSERAPGLGTHLYDALGKCTPVIGVAKTRYADTPAAEVLRGMSHRPLFVTSMGVDLDVAARRVREMHGSGRLPTLIKRADILARSARSASEAERPLPA
jgi:deoxyribonuclease V